MGKTAIRQRIKKPHKDAFASIALLGLFTALQLGVVGPRRMHEFSSAKCKATKAEGVSGLGSIGVDSSLV